MQNEKRKREGEGGEDANEVFMLENLIRKLKIWQMVRLDAGPQQLSTEHGNCMMWSL